MILYDTVIVHVCYGLNVLALYKYLFMEKEIFLVQTSEFAH